MQKFVIIGASQAGSQLAVNLRERGFEGAITLIGDEPDWPYQRPPLSKAYLAGTADRQTLMLRDEDFYRQQNIEVVLNCPISSVDMTTHIAHAADGREFPFDKIAFTTGARVRTVSIPGSELSGICYLRTTTDADQLKHHMETAKNVVVVGGGFIGLEAAAVATAAGKNTTVVEAFDRLLARVVAPEMSTFYKDAHAARGTHVVLGSGVSAFHGEGGKVVSVELSDGSSIPADLVIVGVGVIANAELAAAAGLEVTPGGIVVDDRARTSHPDAVAAGDCVVLPLEGSEGLVRLESVQNAMDQANIAAASMLDIDEKYNKVPWFWSDQADLKLQIAGLSQGYDAVITRGDMSASKFSLLYYRGEQLISIQSVNSPADYLSVRKMLTAGKNLPMEAARDLSVPLKTHAN